MESPPENRTVRDGRDETFSCKAGGAPTPNITWIFNGITVFFSSSASKVRCQRFFSTIHLGRKSYLDTTVLVPSGRLQILEDGSLLIAAVRATDAGKYTCIRTNEAGSVEESAFLSVLGMYFFLFVYGARNKNCILFLVSSHSNRATTGGHESDFRSRSYNAV